MRVTLVLLASACGKLVWKELLDFLLWHSSTTERCVTFRLCGCHSVFILSFKTTSRSMVKGNMAVKSRRKRHPRSLEHASPTTFNYSFLNPQSFNSGTAAAAIVGGYHDVCVM